MRATGRQWLLCVKRLPNGIFESFKVVVKAEETDKAVKKYREQGYEVY